MNADVNRIRSILLSAIIAGGFLLGTAIPAAACSCVGPQPMSAYAGDPDQVVFSGIVQPPDDRGVPVRVTHWFQGPDVNALVWLDRDGFGADGASCGTVLPPAGTEWIFVAYRTDGRELGVNLCTPHAPASEAEGQAMFADAVATFGERVVLDPVPDSPTATPPTTTPAASDGSSLPVPLLIALATFVAGLAAAVALILGRGRRDQAQRD